MKKWIFIIIFLISNGLAAQDPPFQIYIEPFEFEEIQGLQVFAVGQYDGKWLILGGRLDGLHERQPWASFDETGKNNQVIVIDPENKQKWTAPLTSLSVELQEHLSTTNMQFQQNEEILYYVGGYGYSNTFGKHITYNKLTAINIPETIEAVINGHSFTEYFRQISNPEFAVTGGYLEKIYDTFYLVGGNWFDGAYNPNNMPSFTQEYTNQIRKFKINDEEDAIEISFLPSITDAENLHRRDYNVVPQIFPNYEQGLTAFSGVFQYSADIPYLNSVNIDSSGYEVNNSFSQYYNHYHCAVLPVYSDSANEMHSVFFGGIAQYYDDNGVLTQDNNVPFVNTIARVTRFSDGTMQEFKLPIEMPGLLGAGAEFIPNQNLEYFENEVLKLDNIENDTTLAGYIYGGINSSAPNIFFINDGTQSSASNRIFKVYIIKEPNNIADVLNFQSNSEFKMQVYPNPNNGKFIVNFYSEGQKPVQVLIHNVNGQRVFQKTLTNLQPGTNNYNIDFPELKKGGIFLVTLQTAENKAVQKIVIH